MARVKNLRNVTTFNVGIYLRISVEEERREKESNSITNQRKLLTDYVRSNQDMVLKKEYVDDGFTGTNFNRPAFNKMMQDAIDGVINCVLVKDQSRFGREHIETERYIIKNFRELGIRFIAVVDNYDSLYAGYDMMFSIRNLFNEHYARDISQKCQSAFKAKQRSGEFVGAFASYGYQKSKKDKHILEIDPYAAQIVQRIFSMYLSGIGQLTIANILNEENVLCPSEYKKSNGMNYRNAKRLDKTNYWTYSTIHKMLQNELYTGTMVQGKFKREMRGKPYLLEESEWIKVEDTHPAIIERELFEKVQKLLKQRTVTLPLEENQSIFAGFLKCGDCLRAMSKKIYKRSTGQKYYVFDCGSYVRAGKKFCSSRRIPETVLEEIVLDDLNQIIKKMVDLKSVIEMAESESQKYNDIISMYETGIERKKNTLERIKKLKKKVFEEYALGTITGEEYAEYRAQYVDEEKTLQKDISELMKKCSNTKKIDIFELPWIKRLLEYKEIDKLTREIILEMIDVIYIYKDGRIKITYNFTDEYDYLLKNEYEI